MTDDQGYGDISYHGNPILNTPHTDALAEQSIRLTDFHVTPTSSHNFDLVFNYAVCFRLSSIATILF